MKTYHQIIQNIYKDWILEYTQKLVQDKYPKNQSLKRLLKDLEAWTNQDYQSLSALSNISESSLKRFLGYTMTSSKHISEVNDRCFCIISMTINF